MSARPCITPLHTYMYDQYKTYRRKYKHIAFNRTNARTTYQRIMMALFATWYVDDVGGEPRIEAGHTSHFKESFKSNQASFWNFLSATGALR